MEVFFIFGKCIKYVLFEYIILSKSCYENLFIYFVFLFELLILEFFEGFGILFEYFVFEVLGVFFFFMVCVNFNIDCICVIFVNFEDFFLYKLKCVGRKKNKESLYYCLL